MGPHLSRRVDDFGKERLALVDDLVAEGILDRGVIAFDKVALAILDCEGRFACALRSVCVYPQSSRWTPKHAPTERLPRMAIFRCLTEGAMVMSHTVRFKDGEGERRPGPKPPGAVVPESVSGLSSPGQSPGQRDRGRKSR